MAGYRIRELGINIGHLHPGPYDAITDVPGIWVGQKTLIFDEPRIARTGVTVIMPREGDIWKDNAFAGYHTFNGTGEMTGMHWLEESGMLCYPVVLTNTHQVGTAHQALVAYGQESGQTTLSSLAVIAETWDGWLNDLDAFHITQENVIEALKSAKPGKVQEGNVGGGTGMICHDFKGGIGTASRVVETPSGTFTVGALVQANHGERRDLRVDGVPVGLELDYKHTPSPFDEDLPAGSSIIIILATDAPLLPVQCKRLARRAALGMARVGGIGHNGSGDIFLAFAMGNHIPGSKKSAYQLEMLPHHHLNDLFLGAIESVEESILNALTSAETMTGYQGHTAYALPIEDMLQVMKKYDRL
ncbi:MAG: P1 family peptidase [Anaerolineales bacterium]|jgi:D-aminopeptidase